MSLWVGVVGLCVLLWVDYRERQKARWRARWTERNTVLPSGRRMTIVEPSGLSSAVLSGIPDDELSDGELERKVRLEAADLAAFARMAKEVEDLPECAER